MRRQDISRLRGEDVWIAKSPRKVEVMKMIVPISPVIVMMIIERKIRIAIDIFL